MKSNKLLTRVKKSWQLYVFLLIPVIYILVFAYVPMTGIQIAFKKYNVNDGIWGSPWVGFDYFTKFFKSYQFSRVIKNTLTVSLYGLVAGFPIPIIFALLLNAMKNEKYRKLIQTVTYIPYFISTVVMVGMIMQVFHTRIGLVGLIATTFNIQNPPDLFASPSAFPHLYVWSGIWQGMGWSTIIYMAALSNCDLELHEAMQVDGASRFRRLISLDFQCILPTASILLILNAGGIMNVGFEKVMLMQNNMNVSTSEVILTYVYKIGLAGGATSDFSYATAIGLFNSLVNFALLVIVNTVARKNEGTSLW